MDFESKHKVKILYSVNLFIHKSLIFEYNESVVI